MTETVQRVPRESWTLLFSTLRQQRRQLLTGVAVGLSWTIGKVAVPQLTRLAIDRGIAEDGALLFWTLLILAAATVAGIFAAWRRYIAFRESRVTESTLRERLFAQIQGLHVGFHDRAQTGQLMSRASSDLQQVQSFVVNIPIFASQVTMILLVVVVLLLMNPMLALLALAPLPFINVSARSFSHRIYSASLRVQQEQAQLANVVEESVSGIRVVKGFGAEAVQQAKVDTEAADIRAASMGAARIRAKFLPAIDLLPSIGLITVLGYGGHQVVNGSMTLGELVAFNTYLTMLIWPMRNIGMTVAMGQRAATALTRVNEILSEQPAIASPPRPRHLPSAGIAQPVGAVEFARVRFGYDLGHTDVRVLEGLDWSIAPGESVAVVGATGSGKSTLARLLLRFYDPQSGSVMLDGVDLRELNLRELRRAVGVVFEDTLLFNDTVSANIAFARPDVGSEVIERAARLAGAHDFVLQLPEGYDTTLGERGYSLSGGQRQRIAIARAIVADPRVLVLDDATSAVDPTKEHEIRDALATVMRGRTTIVIAHRPATIELADRAVLLDGGRIAASGSHRELLDTNARYREVLAAMTEKSDAGDGSP
ncbi:MAG: ABC transporter ATP-binding protein [Acidimicrobiales bacterium]